MKTNQILVFTFLFIFCISLVSAANAVTLNTPATDDIISGATYLLNATVDTNTLNLSSANFFYDNGITNTTIGTVANVSVLQFNLTWDTTTVDDVDDLNIWVNVTNATEDTQTLGVSTGVDIDNGNPTATLSSATFVNNQPVSPSTSFTIGIDADNSIGISSCNVFYIRSSSDTVTTVQAVSAAGNACTTTTSPSSQSLGVNINYIVRVEATDGNGNQTNSSNRTLSVTQDASGGSGSISSPIIEDTTDTSSTESLQQTDKPNFLQAIINFFKNLFSSK